MKYFSYLKNGEFNGFYADNVHDVIPESTIKITEELWQELLKSNYKVKDINLIDKDYLYDISNIDFFEEIIFENNEEEPYISLENRVEILENENSELLLDAAIKDSKIEMLENDLADVMMEIAMLGGVK